MKHLISSDVDYGKKISFLDIDLLTVHRHRTHKLFVVLNSYFPFHDVLSLLLLQKESFSSFHPVFGHKNTGVISKHISASR